MILRFKLVIIFLFLPNKLMANNLYFDEGLKLFKNEKYEEAIYNLAKLKLESSDYQKSKELNERLNNICKEFCKQSKNLKIEIEKLIKK